MVTMIDYNTTMIDPTWITASSVRVTSVAWRTLTPVSMVPDNALSTGVAITGVDTVLIATCQHLGTLLVHHTLGPSAGNIGVSSVARRTIAASFVVSALTQSVHSALSETAGGHTVPVDTLLRQRTFQITLAAS